MRLVRYTYPALRHAAPSFGGLPRSPWSGLDSEINRLFETALGGFGAPTPARFAVDLFEDQANTYVRAELPGLNREDINVEMTDGDLTIAATRRTQISATDAAAKDNARAIESYSFSRSVSVGDNIQTDKIGAGYEHGVLTVTLPKREPAQPKKITVAVK